MVARRHPLFRLRPRPGRAGRPLVELVSYPQHNALEPIYPLAAEFGRPQWNFRMSTFAFDTAQQLICSYVQNGVHRLEQDRSGFARGQANIDALSGHLLAARDRWNASISAAARRPARRPSSNSTSPPRRTTALKLSTTQDIEAYRGYLSVPEPVTFDTDNGLAGLRPVLPAAKRRFHRARRPITATDRALPRRSHGCRIGNAQLGHAVLDQPRLCRPRRQLRRQHRLWPRVPPAAARQLGDRRRCRLRQRRPPSRREPASCRSGTVGDQRRPAPAATRHSPC